MLQAVSLTVQFLVGDSWTALPCFLPEDENTVLLFYMIFQESKGYEFESETDTETIPKLIKYMYDNRESEDTSFSALVERVIQQLVSGKFPFSCTTL